MLMSDRLTTSETKGAANASDLISATKSLLFRHRAFTVAAFILLLGPPAGSLFYSVILGAFMLADPIEGATKVEPAASVASFIVLILFSAFLSYLYGGLSALFSAIWLGVRTFRNGSFSYVEAVLTAVVAGGAGALLMVFVIFEQRADELSLLGILIGPGILSALICRWLLGYFNILPGSAPSHTGPA